MTSSHNTVLDILTYIYQNREKLATSKFTGVHYVDGMYRVHKGAFIPTVLDGHDINKKIGEVINICFCNKMVWDSQSLWITIK